MKNIRRIASVAGVITAFALVAPLQALGTQYTVNRSFGEASLTGTVDVPIGVYAIENGIPNPFTAVALTLTVNGTSYNLTHARTDLISGTGQFFIEATATSLTFGTANADLSNPADLIFSDSTDTSAGNLYLIGTDEVPGFEAAYTAAGDVEADVTFPTVFGVSNVMPPPCTITCPADIVQANDPGQYGAVVDYPPPTTSGDCGTVTCIPPSDSVFPVGETTVTATSTSGESCSFKVTVKDVEAPKVTCSVAQPMLWSPSHDLVNVGLVATATDNYPDTLPIIVKIFGNESDGMPTGDGNFSPDAKNIAPGTLRLRAERKGNGGGRVYLIVATATDPAKNVGFASCTVVVPHDLGRNGVAEVNAQATAAKAFCDAHNGAPPPGYFIIGGGPALGPKQ
jgi:hypothetical protein